MKTIVKQCLRHQAYLIMSITFWRGIKIFSHLVPITFTTVNNCGCFSSTVGLHQTTLNGLVYMLVKG